METTSECRYRWLRLPPQPDNAAKSMTWGRFNLASIAGIDPRQHCVNKSEGLSSAGPNIRRTAAAELLTG